VNIYTHICKGNAILVTGHGGPQSCEMLRHPNFLDKWLTDGSEVASLMHDCPLPPGRTLVLISVKRLSQTQGHNAAGRIRPIEKIQSPHWELNLPRTFWLVA
jgi:hypothetical protein